LITSFSPLSAARQQGSMQEQQGAVIDEGLNRQERQERQVFLDGALHRFPRRGDCECTGAENPRMRTSV
jgi:hypothetical protein